MTLITNNISIKSLFNNNNFLLQINYSFILDLLVTKVTLKIKIFKIHLRS
jgi:hypothetical protein